MWFFDLSHFAEGIWRKSYFFFVCLISSWLTQLPCKKCQEEARNASENKGQPPFSNTCKHSTYYKTNQNTDKLTYTPPTHNTRTLRTAKIVTHESSASGKISCLTYTQHHSRNEERKKAIRERCESSCQAPNRDADSYDVLAFGSIRPDTKRYSTESIDYKKRGCNYANTIKAKPQFTCYDIGCPTENIAIKVI